MSGDIFGKLKIKIVIRILQYTTVLIFTQFGKYLLF